MKTIPFLDLKRVNDVITSEISGAIQTVVDSGWYIMGRSCQAFEGDMAVDLDPEGNGYVVGCNSGTDAITLALLAAGVKAGDEVITVAHTAIPTISAIVSIGAIPVFVDIDDATWVMDVNEVADAITEKTKAVVPVHLYGNMVNVQVLRDVLAALGRQDIAVVEDCAQAQGAHLDVHQAGTLGDFGAYSFYPSKNIGALGDGGAVFTHDEAALERLKMFHNYGQRDRYNALVAGGLNSRLDDMQAAVLSVKLKHLHQWNQYKGELMKSYREALGDLPVKFQVPTKGSIPAWHLCVIELPANVDRDTMQRKLLEHGLQTLIHYPHPAHLQKAFADYYHSSLPHTEALAKRILSLPFSYVMTHEEMLAVVKIMKECF